MDAARGGHVPTARFLLKLWPRTDVHFTDALGRSALQIAAETGELETVQFLVNELHLDVLHTDRLGQNSVHSAARAGHSAVVHWLVTEGRCPTHIPDANGRTAEDLATAAGHVKCCEVLRNLCS
ncbi:Ankyrin repeat-containing domain [Trinorchestia longiramus]|nr:Ankyrin repeat-containing domain [Trinorchestia longiramus]